MNLRPAFHSVLGALALGASLFVTPVAAAEISAGQKAEIQTIIKEYLVTNPEVLRDALNELERRQKADEASAREKVISDASGTLFNSKHQVVLGNPNGKVTLVEFFDYNCGYCKRAMEDLAKLMKEDKDLRVVLKDFPVLGPNSVEAAQIAAAARNQLKGEKYWEFHSKLLMTKGGISKTQAVAVAQELGANVDQLIKDANGDDVRAGLEETMRVADSLNLTGTPSYVVGQDLVVGAVGFSELKTKVDNVRKCGKAAC